MRDGQAAGQTFLVGAEGATLGRTPDIEIHVPDEKVSRRHARIEPTGDGYILMDLGSANGTYLNRARVRGRQQLRTGDVVQVGGTHLLVTLDEPSGS